jgi:CRISPR system Cascade subunit CasA
MDTLNSAIITTLELSKRNQIRRSLPGVFAALARDEISDFPALRPHQRHIWHAFIVQVAALALLKAGLNSPPDDDDAWRALLLGLTPDNPDGAAWALVSPPELPAMLQAPVPGGDLTAFKTVETPDLLDMLVTSKNHDLKAAKLAAAEPEHWLFALVSLQTQEGFLGAGNYGISRMNGGFASRPGFGIEPRGNLGVRFQRDVSRLLELRAEILRDHDFPSQDGIGLVWLKSWDGASSLQMCDLDPFYVEICRRVRLVQAVNGHITALRTISKAARIEAKAFKGNTGDPWTPLIADGDGRKAFTLDAGGLGYRRLVPLLFPKSSEKAPAQIAPLQEIGERDAEEGLVIVARALVRGQGKTEGFHERRVPISKTVCEMMRRKATDRVAQCAHGRVEDAGLFAKKVLYPAMMAVFTGAPGAGERKRDDDTTKERARRASDAFDRRIDLRFFDDLNAELDAPPVGAAHMRAHWLLDLHDIGREVLEAAIRSAPDAAMRHWRMQVVARDVFEGCFKRQFRDNDRIPEDIWKARNAGAVDTQTAQLVETDHD